MNNRDRSAWGILGAIAVILLLAVVLNLRAHAFAQGFTPKVLGVWLGGLATLALYSILYKENPVYRLAEHIYLGLAAGYVVVVAWTDVLSTQWYDPIFKEGKWLWLWVVPLAAMAYFVFSRKHGWISRIPLVILGGFAAGQVFQAFAKQYFPQIRDSFRSLRPTVMSLQNPHPSPETLSISGAINNAVFLITLLSVVTYFLFAFEQKSKAVRNFALTGRWLIMIGFGAIFGSTIMTRFALLVDRMYFLLIEWMRAGTGGA